MLSNGSVRDVIVLAILRRGQERADRPIVSEPETQRPSAEPGGSQAPAD